MQSYIIASQEYGRIIPLETLQLLILGTPTLIFAESYDNYSLPDLNNFNNHTDNIKTSRTHENGKNDNFIFIHTILPVNGDINIMTFNKEKNKFKKPQKYFL